ncbi:hypothetical protein LPB19_09055 [Marinobacter salinisoli]|uniref:Uncharacterized protein n=1 Tax=Marinobacter salinisoli TaxID=2769486 RepID=A0ABX7MMM4_9GAMM|nr:hypothetical protein [Marinobacter salinisoli]QSP93383.1 hypothetical protein LPB19_09055 [Marinobacter salinisoli]
MRHLLCIVMAAALTMGFAAASVYYDDWTLLPRAGAIIVVMGLLVEYWPLLRTPSVETVSREFRQSIHTSTRVTISLTCYGTIIWAFGDLIGQLV